MGKGARNRAIMQIAVAATVGRPREVTRSLARAIRRRNNAARTTRR